MPYRLRKNTLNLSYEVVLDSETSASRIGEAGTIEELARRIAGLDGEIDINDLGQGEQAELRERYRNLRTPLNLPHKQHSNH